nr:Calcium-transporting ATPase [Chlamydiota bacterium]
FQTDLKKGLTGTAARARLSEVGANVLPRKKGSSIFKLLFRQFSSPIIWLLLAAAAVSGFFGEFIDSFAILAIVILNAVLGFFQEFHAEHSLQALQKLASPTSKVIREGVLQTLPSKELVPGDLILLEAGDRIPADGRVVQSTMLAIEEAALTGESLPTHKGVGVIAQTELALGDRKNMVHMGTAVVSGKGHALVTDTGLRTEIGKIAHFLEHAEKEETPLQRQLGRLGTHLVWICLAIIAVVFVLGLVRGLAPLNMALIALSLAVAAIPEGLPAVVTIALAIGVKKMAARKALIRRLSSVETLGSTAIICSDKTGTLTQNKMTVRTIWTGGEWYDVEGLGYSPEGAFSQEGKPIDPNQSPALIKTLTIGVLCNEANIHEQEGKWLLAGDPTEGALLTAAGKAGLFQSSLQDAYPRLDEIPFDSDRKMMSVLCKGEVGNYLYVKGAPDRILASCTKVWRDGKEVPLRKSDQEEITAALDALTKKAYRVIGLAYRYDGKLEESDLVFVGMEAMIDPPREEVFHALEQCRSAGVRPVMATGDHKETALAIARELHMADGESRALSGEEFDQLSDEELDAHLDEISVFARISAAHKLRIIEAYRRKGSVIAMTGDGVNDAPAIQSADIGIAMGITGSDVTKEVADMVVLDDNFASIVGAIEEGRGIYDNIVKFVSYLLSSNIAEIAVIFLVMAFGFGGAGFVPLLPVQLLWMNLVTDGFPAIALALDPVDPAAMSRPPRPRDQQILNARFFFFILSISALVTIGALIACFYGLESGPQKAQTMTFTTLIMLELVRVQMIRAQYHLTFRSNWWLVVALLSSFILQLVVIYIPSLQIVFSTMALTALDWAVMVAIAAAVWISGRFVARLFY